MADKQPEDVESITKLEILLVLEIAKLIFVRSGHSSKSHVSDSDLCNIS